MPVPSPIFSQPPTTWPPPAAANTNWGSNLQSQSNSSTASTLYANWGTYYKYLLNTPASLSIVNSSLLYPNFYTAVSRVLPQRRVPPLT